MKIFTEKQKITQWWLWAMLLVITGFAIYAMVLQIFLDKPVGNNPTSDWALILIFIFMLVMLGFMRYITLHTKIDEAGIHIKFIPFFSKSYHWDDIESIETTSYRFVGYGIRMFTKYGTVYNVKGNKGFAFTLKSGKKYLIGTQEPEKVQQLIEKYHSKNES